MKEYAILGYPIKHTMSPPIHKRLFELSGVTDYEYKVLEISPEELPLKKDEILSLDGLNVTIPHKIGIIEYLDELHPSAERYGSVNCILNKDGKHIGYNTDCDGFLRSVKAAGAALSGNVLQCGCGGVGRMTAIEIMRSGADLTLSLLEGFEGTADPVIEYAEKNNCKGKITIVHPDEISGKFDLLVNASPVGMFPKIDACPVTEDTVRNCGFVFDIVYNPEKTKLLHIAAENNIPSCGGMAMLVWQAVVAHEYWDGSSYSDDSINKLIDDMHKMMK